MKKYRVALWAPPAWWASAFSLLENHPWFEVTTGRQRAQRGQALCPGRGQPLGI